MTRVKRPTTATLRADMQAAAVFLYGPVGDMPDMQGISPQDLAQSLPPLRGRRITVHLNSPGGDLAAAVAMYNQLRTHPGGVDVLVEGEAASAGSIILMAGDHRAMASGSHLMIHEPYVPLLGTAAEHEQAAVYLRKVTESALDIYAGRTGLDRRQLAQWMAEETWWTAREAVAAGLADEVVDTLRAAAYSGQADDRRRFGYRHPPAPLPAVRTTDDYRQLLGVG